MSHFQLIWLSSIIALLGTGVLTFSAVVGNLLALHTAHNFMAAIVILTLCSCCEKNFNYELT